MISYEDGQRFYLSAWEFNTAMILERLEKVIKDNGGEVKPANHWVWATNRKVEGMEPIKLRGQNYISFVLDGMYYYFQTDNNPFFGDMYVKTRVNENGERRKNVMADYLSRAWADGRISYHNKYVVCCDVEKDLAYGSINEDEVKEYANLLFNELILADPGEVYHDKHYPYDVWVKALEN